MNLEDDIISGVVTGRLRALAEDMPLAVLIVDDYLTKGVREPELISRNHAGLHTYSLRVQLREARAALALATRRPPVP